MTRAAAECPTGRRDPRNPSPLAAEEVGEPTRARSAWVEEAAVDRPWLSEKEGIFEPFGPGEAVGYGNS